MDQEPVRASISNVKQEGSIRRVSVWMENEAGTMVLSGAASCDGYDCSF